MISIFLGLGCNLGDRKAQLLRAIEQLERKGVCCQIERSGFYESPALMPEGAPPEWNLPFLNCVISAQTTHEPEALLAAVKAIEADMGRQHRGHWAPREMDIDILAYDSEVIATESLAIPHPQLHKRDFVLLPWCDLAPHWCHPLLGLTIEDLAAMLPNPMARKVFLP